MRDLFGDHTYPHAPGYKEHTTSRKAAERLLPRYGTLKAEVFHAFFGSELTADEVATLIGKTPFAVRPRVTELYKMGLIERTGVERPNASGIDAHVYRLVKR